MQEKEVEKFADKYGMTVEEYLRVLSDIKDNVADVSISNMNIDEEAKNTTSSVRLLTGVPEIDDLTKGLTTGVHVIAGFRKCCKSTFAINMIYRALNDGLNVVLLSLEMSKIDVLNTLISLHSFEVNAETAITRDELAAIYELDREAYNNRLYSFLSLPGQLIIYTENDLAKNAEENKFRHIYNEGNLDSIFVKANQACYNKTGKQVQVLVVDNINCIRTWGGKGTGEYAYSNASNYFRRVALNFGKNTDEAVDEDSKDKQITSCAGGAPVICLLLCQINRAGGEKASFNGFYPESCIAETVNIERDATTIIPIYTNANYLESNIAFIKLEASRYTKSMLHQVEIPANLEYGKLGMPICQINVDKEKEQKLRVEKKYKVVYVKTPEGKKAEILVPVGEDLPDGYEEIIELSDDYDEEIGLFHWEDDDDEEDI